MKKSFKYTFVAILCWLYALPSYAGIDWSQYGDGPEPGFKDSAIAAVIAVVLFGIFKVIDFANDGKPEGCALYFSVFLGIAMALCAIVSMKIVVPIVIVLYILHLIFKGDKK